MPVINSIKHALHLDGKHQTAASSTTTEQPAAAAAPAAAAVPATTTTTAAQETPAFSSDDVTVFFVLGGPGVGKGTQCANLVKDYHFVHLSAGDLLRAEQERPESQYGAMIKEYITEGKIVPMEVTVKLLENAMRAAVASPPSQWAETSSKPRFLIDGFPRKMDQAIKFDESVCASKAVLFFSATEEIMLERLLERAKTSGRDDDNKESIIKRFRTFVETSMPVVNYYRGLNKVFEVPAIGTKDEVYVEVRQAVDTVLAQC